MWSKKPPYSKPTATPDKATANHDRIPFPLSSEYAARYPQYGSGYRWSGPQASDRRAIQQSCQALTL
jgi:hypothetical protein